MLNKSQELSKEETILKDFSTAYTYFSPAQDEIKEDYEYYLGKQWTDSEMTKSINAKQGKLTQVNNIRPYVNLVCGYQRQNRNDILAYPEGEEDSLQAEVITRLIKNTLKISKTEFDISELYQHGIISGGAFLYPFIDYTNNLIYGELKFNLQTGLEVYYDPKSRRYDLSDARYVIIVKDNLSKEQIKELFPEEEKKIDEIIDGSLNKPNVATARGNVQEFTKYYFKNNEPTNSDGVEFNNDTYDLLEYYYKKFQNKYFLVDMENGGIRESYKKEDFDEILQKAEELGENRYKVVTKREPVVYRCCMVGNTIIKDDKAEFTDHWREYPVIPFYPYFCDVNIDVVDKAKLTRQGLVRSLKAPQREKNVARTHAIRNITSSANSGWLVEEDSLVNKNAVKKQGTQNGVIIEYKKKAGSKPERIPPAPLSQGFTYLADQNTEDFKQISGINADLLSMDKGTDSGRAIMLRQRQGLIMIQSIMDNFSRSYEIFGRFMVSVLPILYTPDRVERVLGEAFINQHFGVDMKQQDPATGETVVTGRQVDKQKLYDFIENKILNDRELLNYNISVGEGLSSETIKMYNFMTLNELAQSGYPIPPDVLIDESNLPNATKEKIKQSMQRQAQNQGGK